MEMYDKCPAPLNTHFRGWVIADAQPCMMTLTTQCLLMRVTHAFHMENIVIICLTVSALAPSMTFPFSCVDWAHPRNLQTKEEPDTQRRACLHSVFHLAQLI
jgi:hypothetical protein